MGSDRRSRLLANRRFNQLTHSLASWRVAFSCARSLSSFLFFVFRLVNRPDPTNPYTNVIVREQGEVMRLSF